MGYPITLDYNTLNLEDNSYVVRVRFFLDGIALDTRIADHATAIDMINQVLQDPEILNDRQFRKRWRIARAQ
jgi:hypothetical protein